ncbi:MAG TPA: hypothetical protein VMX58_06965 [Patescibacteria group bacterium]|nr:hypothetical protein [Patescibacteria group bacterium]
MSGDQGGVRNRIVVHYKDGALRKGYTHDFNPVRNTFHLITDSGDDGDAVREVNVAELVAVFFVKTLGGDRYYSEKKSFNEVDSSKLKGLKIKVTLRGGEVIRGVTLGYNRNKKGFFVVPVDPRSNNERIYVVSDAVSSVSLGDDAEE